MTQEVNKELAEPKEEIIAKKPMTEDILPNPDEEDDVSDND